MSLSETRPRFRPPNCVDISHLRPMQGPKTLRKTAIFTNSGIFVRCKDPKAIGAKTCYEVNIFDTRPDASYGTGSIVYFAEVNPMPKAAGKWNTFEITAQGRQITVLLNGQKTADLNNGMFEEGHFTLQWGAGVVKFRKVAVKPL